MDYHLSATNLGVAHAALLLDEAVENAFNIPDHSFASERQYHLLQRTTHIIGRIISRDKTMTATDLKVEKQQRHKRLYNLHSWTGIIVGLLIFIVSLSGCIALFDNEIHTWEDPALRIALPEDPVAVDPLFEEFWSEANAQGEIVSTNLFLPSHEYPFYMSFIRVKPEGTAKEHDDPILLERKWHPKTGQVLPNREDGLSRWLLDFHRNLNLPRQLGRALVGVVGILLLLSIITGVLIHRKLLKELFTMRFYRSVRLKWQDAHKVIGLWGLPFFTIISFTGAFLGIVTILAPLAAFLAFKGDTETLIDAVVGSHAEPTGVQTQMLSLDELRQIKHPQVGTKPSLLIFENWKDETAEVELLYEQSERLERYRIMKISGANGNIMANDKLTTDTPGTRVTNALTPLHYGTYGGISLKFLYLLLGLSLCVITALGSMMWIERRLHGHEGSKSKQFYERLNRFNTGTMLGIIVTSIALFHFDKIYWGVEQMRFAANGWAYFGIWFAIIVYAMTQQNQYAVTRQALSLTGILMIAIPLTNGVATDNWFWTELVARGATSAWVDLSFLILGFIGLLATSLMPAKRLTENASDENEALKTRDMVPAE